MFPLWQSYIKIHSHLAIYYYLKVQNFHHMPQQYVIAKLDHILGGNRHMFESHRSHLHFCYKFNIIFHFKAF